LVLISPAKISNQRIADWSARILFVLVAVSAAQLTWLLVPTGDGVVGHPVTPRVEAVGGGTPKPGLAAVAGLDLFGRAEQQVAESPKAVDAPQTRLNLTLRGVVAAGEGPSARAIIAAPGQPEEHYRVGDSVPGGAVLEQVLADRVILRRGGRLEALHLPKEASVGSAAPSAPAATPRMGAPAAAPSLPPSAIRKLQEYREKIVREPQQAFSLARVQPVMEGGRLKGYRLSPTRERQLFRQLGLRPGDVVTSVNGIGLDNPAQMGQVFSQLTQAGELNLTVERNGVQTSVTVPFGQ
jgi:general secretion pathway protein C